MNWRAVASHLLAHRNSVAKMARPRGIKIIAGPGRISIAKPIATNDPPARNTITLRQSGEPCSGCDLAIRRFMSV